MFEENQGESFIFHIISYMFLFPAWNHGLIKHHTAVARVAVAKKNVNRLAGRSYRQPGETTSAYYWEGVVVF